MRPVEVLPPSLVHMSPEKKRKKNTSNTLKSVHSVLRVTNPQSKAVLFPLQHLLTCVCVCIRSIACCLYGKMGRCMRNAVWLGQKNLHFWFVD